MKSYPCKWILALSKLEALHPHRNLCVQIQEAPDGSCHAILVDLEEFCGSGISDGVAIDALADDLERVAAEIRRSKRESLVVHLLSQEGQPYGARSHCCNHCGTVILGKMTPGPVAHVDNWTDWRSLPNNCGAQK